MHWPRLGPKGTVVQCTRALGCDTRMSASAGGSGGVDCGGSSSRYDQAGETGIPLHLVSSLSASSLFTHSSQTSCGPESSGSELAPATPAPCLLQGLLGSDDEEQEDPKDYCKGKAWPWLHVTSQIATARAQDSLRVKSC